MQFGKVGEGHVRYMTFVSWKSPELEVNDIGYSQNVDDIFQVAWVGLRFWDPVFIFRNININFNQWTGWDFGGTSTYKGGNINLNLQLKNYWSFLKSLVTKRKKKKDKDDDPFIYPLF